MPVAGAAMIASDGSVIVFLRNDSSDVSAGAERARRGVELVGERARLLGEVASLELTGGVDELAHDAVENHCRPLRVRAGERQLDELAVLRERDFDSRDEPRRHVARIDDGEGDDARRSEHVGGGLPAEADGAADGVARDSTFDDAAFLRRQRVFRVGRIGGERVRAGAQSGARLEAGENRGITRVLRPQIERELADHVVHDRRALDQIRRRTGRDEGLSLIGPWASPPPPPLRLFGDPDGALRLVRGRHEPRDAVADAGAGECHQQNEPLVALERREVAHPRNSGLVDGSCGAQVG